MRVRSSVATGTKSFLSYRFVSGKVETWTSSEPWVAETRLFACSTFQPAGAWNVSPAAATVCHCVFDLAAPDPSQPARITVANRSACLHRIIWGIRRAVTKRKDPTSMAKTKDKVYDAAENVKPYVERAMSDEKLRDDVMSAFSTAKELYSELVGGRGAVTLATRVATDEEIKDKLSEAVTTLRN